jgi:type VI secretion system protein VasD
MMICLPRRGFMVGLLLGMVGCGGDEPPPPPPPPPPPAPPPPKVVNLTLRAAPDVNPDGAGLASPVVVRIYQLSGTTKFGAADFFNLQQDEAGTLGDELVGSDTLVMAPGAIEVYTRELGEEVRFLGITAAFRDLSAGKWRSFHATPPATTTLLEAEIGGTEVSMRKAGL